MRPPKVLNLRHLEEMPEGAILCDRTTVWGNPYVIGRSYDGSAPLTRRGAVGHYENKILPKIKKEDLQFLKGHDLVCHCAPLDCHCYPLLCQANNFIRVLVCGGRTYQDREFVNLTLDYLHHTAGVGKIIQGFARGADKLAHEWARSREVWSTNDTYEITSFQWDQLGMKAGSIRNQAMLDHERVDLVVAFPGGAGTADMIRRAKSEYKEIFDLRYMPKVELLRKMFKAEV